MQMTHAHMCIPMCRYTCTHMFKINRHNLNYKKRRTCSLRYSGPHTARCAGDRTAVRVTTPSPTFLLSVALLPTPSLFLTESRNYYLLIFQPYENSRVVLRALECLLLTLDPLIYKYRPLALRFTGHRTHTILAVSAPEHSHIQPS